MLELQMHEAQMMKRQGKKIIQIAEHLGKSERMIHYYLSEPSRPRKKRTYTSKIDPFKPYIDTILDEDPTFNREVLLRNLRKQKYRGSITILREYAAAKAAETTTKAVIRFETEPGYQAQVDWKLLNTQQIDGKLRKLYAFVMIFGYSRKPFVIHTTSMDQATFLMCHVLAFSYFGGVPSEILYDNMKTAFIYSTAEEKWRPNKHLLELARHYCFTPRRCQVRRPQTKGKVERFIHYYENNFFIEHKGRELSLDELNETVLAWIEEINAKPIQGLDESRNTRFVREKSFLIPSPEKVFDCRPAEQVMVSRESLVRVKSNWYSVPPVYIGKKLTLRIDPLSSHAEIYHSESLIRGFMLNLEEKNQRFYLTEHQNALKALWEKQFSPKTIRKSLPMPEVSTRSPLCYEKLFLLEGTAS